MITAHDIILQVARKHYLTLDEILERDKSHDRIAARREAAWRIKTESSLNDIQAQIILNMGKGAFYNNIRTWKETHNV